jgi:hypothetical protein
MPLIPTKLHGVLDYAGGVGSLAAPRLLRDKRAAAVMAAAGAGTLANSALTDYELGIRRLIPMRVHLINDAATGAVLLGVAALLRRSKRARVLDWVPLAAVGVTEIAAAVLTQRQPSDRAGSEDSLPGAATGVPYGGVATQTSAAEGPPLAPPPVETPGPSVTPPETPESDVERTERVDAGLPADHGDGVPDDDVYVAQQASAAAAEAARIGGSVPSETGDPSMDPVYQAGGGEQEGWEEAEADLIENATHGDGHAQPERDALSPELEADRSTAVYGESDRIPSTEVVDDPNTGSDDPGEGPGLAAERDPAAEGAEDRPEKR